MHVLVTGGAGFIGSAIVDLLVARGDQVRVVDNLHPLAHRGRPAYLNPGAEYSWGDLRDPEVAEAAVREIDAVSHQAAMVGLGVDFADVVDYVGHNDLATAQLLRALHDRRFDGRLVLASSMVVYGEGAYSCPDHGAVRPAPRIHEHLELGNYEPPCPHCGADLVAEPVDEDAHTDPRNVYATTKLAQEHLVAAYARENGASWIGLRYHNIYGPRMPRNTPYAGVASIFRSAAEEGRAPRVFEDGGQRRDFVHVTDVARANLAALDADPSVQGPYNIATGTPRTVLDLAHALTDAIPGAPAPQVVGGHRAGDVRHVFASPRRAHEVFGFETTIPFERGLAAFATDLLRG
jgi:dTDP-L-rhamnose 4-epimerase